MILVVSMFMIRYGSLVSLADFDRFLDDWYE